MNKWFVQHIILLITFMSVLILVSCGSKPANVNPEVTHTYYPASPKPTNNTPSPTNTPTPTPGPDDMPKVGDIYFPTNKTLETHDYLGYYSGEECRLTNDNTLYCTFYWYQDEDDKLYIVYQADTVNNVITQTHKYNPQIWSKYEENRKNINIVPHNTYDHTKEVELYDTYRKIKREKVKQTKKENTPDFCKYDYQDYYDMNGDLYESEDEVYDLFEEYCW